MRKFFFIILLSFFLFKCSSNKTNKNIVVFYLNKLNSIKNISSSYPKFNFKYIKLSKNFKENSKILNNTLPTLKNTIAITIMPDSISLSIIAFFKRENIITFVAGAFNPYFYMLNYNNVFLVGIQPFIFVNNLLKNYNENNSTIITDSSYISKNIKYILEKKGIKLFNKKITNSIQYIFWTTNHLQLREDKKNIILYPSNLKGNNIITSNGNQYQNILYPLNYYKTTLDILSNMDWKKLINQKEKYILKNKYFKNLHYIK